MSSKKKSSKSTRRARVKKEQLPAKKPTANRAEDKNVVETTTEEITPDTNQMDDAFESARPLDENQNLQRQRRRMIFSMAALLVVITMLIVGASVMRGQNSGQQSAKSGETPGKADEILQSGGNVCSNGSSPADVTGSANPESVGMMLQTVPTNTIQTPQTLDGGSDANTLQGAACF